MARMTAAAGLLAIIAAALQATATRAQETSRWIKGQAQGACSMLTNNKVQPIPTAGFGVSAETSKAFSLLVRGYMEHDGVSIRKATVAFGAHTAEAQKIAFSNLGEPNLYGLALTLDAVHLGLLAEEPRFTIILDGEPLTTYVLAEHGPMVVAMARCMRGLP